MKQAIELVHKLVKCSSLDELESTERREGIITENIKQVLPLVCEYYGTEEKEVFGRSKRYKNVEARYMVYLLLHEFFHYSYQEICQYLKKDLSGLRNRCSKMKESNTKSFETLCQKLYNECI
jgi:chromosomal replication initiation ATPase DnaA